MGSLAQKLTPSAFQKQMSLTTKQRLASTWEMNLPWIVQLLDRSETFHHKVSAVDPDQTLFHVFPSEVVFQNYVPHEVCEMPLVLRNRDMVPQLVKVTMESSPYFKLVGPGGECCEDCLHQLLCITNRGKFIVPIQAVVLDFPAQLDFSVCPVKYSTQKTLLVCNLAKQTHSLGGHKHVAFQWSPHQMPNAVISQDSPFSVIPAVGTLDTGDTVQVTVEFLPLQTRDRSTPLVVHCGTGEDTHTSLHGSAVNVHIRLDRNSVTVEKTYITLSNHSTVTILNHSNVTAHFQWKAFATQEEEDQLKQRFCHRLCQEENAQADNFLEWSRADTTRGERLSLLSHIYQNERAKVQGDPMLFCDDIFTIKLVKSLSRLETRLLLHLRPQLHFKSEELDTEKVFVGQPTDMRGCVIRPTLHFDVHALHLGDISFGFPRTLSCRLTNTSLMPMAFTLHIPGESPASPAQTRHPGTLTHPGERELRAGTCSHWRIEPSKGVIPPESEVSLTVTANLDDTGKFEDKVKLFIENSEVNIIPVQAVGVGTTIVTDKPFSLELNFKPHFSLTPCCYQFKITNKGRHTHQLFWTTEGFSIVQQRRASGTTKDKSTSQVPKPASPVFKLQPPQMELVPGQTKDMVLEGFSSTPQGKYNSAEKLPANPGVHPLVPGPLGTDVEVNVKCICTKVLLRLVF
ncbi:hydrocephalus-inducing protein homolog [Manacus vitellinus]|uniref:hydrocephalus-inducing protein homolog n=1 Tax=Manacus vitellinus TaxID=328815 RepID=UPI00115CF836|nr:hydrocephalus-inducing protein homolog [Manacus vitellinus]